MPGERHVVLATIDEDERPVSIRVLGAYAESLGARVTLLVIIKPLAAVGRPVVFSPEEVSQIHSFLEREKVTHLGFYLMTAGLKPYAELVQALRQAGYGGVIMAGGVHSTLCPGPSLVKGADFAVQGPGELPLAMILADEDKTAIPGLVWRKGREIVVNPQTPAQKLDLDSLPYPIFRFGEDWILVDGELRPLTWSLHCRHATWGGRYYDMVTSRGCLYRCTYCCNVNGAPMRRCSVDRVIAELRALREREPRITGVNFQDDCFYAGSDQWLEQFSTRMKGEIGLPFIARMIPRFVTRERIELLKSAGLHYVTMGLEASDRLNKQVFNRHETTQSFLKAARIILDGGLYLSTDILIHNPYETEADLREVALTLNSLPRPRWGVVALSLTAFPNTPLHARAAKDKMLDRFATDPFDSMLVPSRPGGYHTPRFWLLLITKLLSHIPGAMGAQLISTGAGNPEALRFVEQRVAQIERTRRVHEWLRSKTIWLVSIPRQVAKLFSLPLRLWHRHGS
ncbi:MAG: radical SAM protein [Planctomycetota bacterium]